MKKLSNFTAFVIGFLFLFLSCQKEEIDVRPQPDPDYPTVYNPLSASELVARNTEFQQVNIHEGLSLNEYGFIKGEIFLSDFDTITKELVINCIDSLVSRYQSFFGIPNGFQIDYETHVQVFAPYPLIGGASPMNINSFFLMLKEAKENGYYEDLAQNIQYKFMLRQQKFKETLIEGLDITFEFDEQKKSVKIEGFWIPQAVLPASELFDEGEAISIAYREILKQSGRDIWETKQNFRTYTLLRKIKRGDAFEIRHCWLFYTVEIPFVGRTIAVYIDSQTGDVVNYYDRL
jgi:hypothetical protein